MNFPGDFPWTEENVERLKALAQEGLSATQIAKELGCASKNVVCGKLDRLGIERKKKKAKTDIKARAPRKPSKLLADVVPFAKAAIAADFDGPSFARDAILDKWPWPALKSKHQVTFWDAKPGQCKWPNDGSVLAATYRQCGARALSGCVYCGAHERMSRAGWRTAA